MFAASKTDSASTGGYQISRSLRFNSADSAYLNRTPATATNRKTFTWSCWAKLNALSGTNYTFFGCNPNAGTTDYSIFRLGTDSTLKLESTGTGVGTIAIGTTAVYRDPSAWYHIVWAVDTTQATASDRVKLYVNGVQVTSFATATYPAQNSDTYLNSTALMLIGSFPWTAAIQFFNGYMTEINFIDGQALTPSSFGETNAQTGVWQPKAYSGSYGTNGFYLNFSDNSNTTAATLGKDYSGNGNNWTPNNFSVTAGAGNDSLVDSPTSYGTDTGVGGTVRGNYCTWNPLDIQNSVLSLTNGNLDYSGGTTGFIGSRGTIGMTSGKWYWEITAGGAGNVYGIMTSAATTVGIDFYPGRDANGWGYYGGNGNKFNNNSGTAYGATFTNGDVIGIAFDADAGTLVFYKNNTSQGTAFSSLTSGPYFPAFGESATTGSTNFGQRPFAYTAPSGFKALCTQNLPTPTIGATSLTTANKFFDVSTWTGNGGAQTIANSGSMQPDLIWAKSRSNGSTAQAWTDAVRGPTALVTSDSSGAEQTLPSSWVNPASNGIALNTTNVTWNGSGYTYVGWQWKANGSGSSNTAGSITSTVSANTTSGFSVVTYTGNGTGVAANGTVGHGLGVVPSMIIIKRRDNTGFWYVATKDGGTNTSPTYSVFTRGSSGLNQTGAAFATGQSYVSSGYISSSTFNLYWLNAAVTAGDSYDINYNTGTYVAYCFAEVAGYSKFGSYTGNGSADGAFVFTGFRPAYVMIKPSSAAGAWWINDDMRDTYNVNDHRINANTSDAEATSGFTQQDFLSNGFKWRNSDSAWNGSGVTYIYMAFAENPFKYSLAR